MKNLIKSTFALGLLLGNFLVQSQSSGLQGIATYKTAATFSMAGDSSLSPAQQAAIRQQISKATQKEYTLAFNGFESTYKEVQSLDKKTAPQAGNVMVRVATGSSLSYKNTKKGQYLESADLFGKPFLIDDKLEKIDWQLTGKKKQIGKYECQQASYTREVITMEVDTESGAQKEATRTVEVNVWFTTQIPVNHGPEELWGLPGLIMEVDNGSFKIICSKISLNPEDEVNIEKPKSGKSITRDEFSKLREEKMKEMMEQYNGSGTERRVIRIGG